MGRDFRALDLQNMLGHPGTAALPLAPQPRPAHPPAAIRGWLAVWCLLLAGYALFGKGWAYVGVPPLFVGELVLLAGLLMLPFLPQWCELLRQPTGWLLAGFMLWGAWRTIPYLGEHGPDALRDAVLWGYGLFAIVVAAGLLRHPDGLRRIVRGYARLAPLLIVALPAIWLTARLLEDRIPAWPWADARVIDFKAGDAAVHLAGLLALFISGLAGRVSPWRFLLLFVVAGAIGVENRGGLLAVAAVFVLCLLHRPASLWLWGAMSMAAAIVLALAATGASIPLPGADRELSYRQVAQNMESVMGDSDNASLEDTKEWRMAWWRDIAGYTFEGRYFWSGKGYGINLADADGYQGTAWEGRLRSPHNGHMTVLARSGVPGFLLWVLLHGSWLVLVGCGYLDARRRSRRSWSGLFFVVISLWTAMMICGSFDVYLEGPMGGIWLWSVMGIGLAAAILYQRRPALFAAEAAGHSPAAEAAGIGGFPMDILSTDAGSVPHIGSKPPL